MESILRIVSNYIAKHLPKYKTAIQSQTYIKFQANLINDSSAKKDSLFIQINKNRKWFYLPLNANLDYIFSIQNKQYARQIKLVDSNIAIAKYYYKNLIYCFKENNTKIPKSSNTITLCNINCNKDITQKTKNKNLADKIELWYSIFKVYLIKYLRLRSIKFTNSITDNVAIKNPSRHIYFLKQGLTIKKTYLLQKFFANFLLFVAFLRKITRYISMYYHHKIINI